MPSSISELMKSSAYTNSMHPNHQSVQQQVADWFNKEYANDNNKNTRIISDMFYNQNRIDEIDNERVAGAVFDMFVMTSPANVGRIIQNTLNKHQGTGLTIDGIAGSRTIAALNSIPENQIDNFMDALMSARLNFLQGLPGWGQFGRGWTNRTMQY